MRTYVIHQSNDETYSLNRIFYFICNYKFVSIRYIVFNEILWER